MVNCTCCDCGSAAAAAASAAAAAASAASAASAATASADKTKMCALLSCNLLWGQWKVSKKTLAVPHCPCV